MKKGFTSLALCGALSLAASSLGSTFEGLRLYGTSPYDSNCTARADWSSDLGVDYEMGLQPDGTGHVQGTGAGTYHFSKPLLLVDSGFSLDFRLASRGGSAGDTYTRGNISVPTQGDINPNKVLTFNLHSKLGLNDPGYGISTAGNMVHFLSFTGDFNNQPIYWAAEWVATIRATGSPVGRLSIIGLGMDRQNVVDGYVNGVSATRGTFSGQVNYIEGGNVDHPAFAIESYLVDGISGYGYGEIDFTVRLSFSTTPITTVPSNISTTVAGSSGLLRKLNYLGQNLDNVTNLASLPSGMQVLGTGDFDQNGTSDVIIRGDADGAGPTPVRTFLWLYLGSKRLRIVRLPNTASSYTIPVCMSDLDFDGSQELLVGNPSTSRVRAYEIPIADLTVGSTIVGAYSDQYTLPYHASYSHTVGVGDFNGDGWQDLVLQNPSTGALRYRLLEGTTTLGYSKVITNDVPAAKFLGVAQLFNPRLGLLVDSPDGTGPRTFWDMNGTARLGVVDLLGDEAYRSWSVVGIGN
ncbi:MAG: hypothetical protein ACAH95_09450 [Fimbriimonas sp.]